MDLRKQKLEEIRQIRLNGENHNDIYSKYIDFLYNNYCDRVVFKGEYVGELSAAFENLKTGARGFLCYDHTRAREEEDADMFQMIEVDISDPKSMSYLQVEEQEGSVKDLAKKTGVKSEKAMFEIEGKARLKSIREYIKTLEDYLIFSYIALPHDSGLVPQPYLEPLPQIFFELEEDGFLDTDGDIKRGIWCDNLDLVFIPQDECGFHGFYVSNYLTEYKANSFFESLSESFDEHQKEKTKFYLLDEKKYQDLKGYCDDLCLIGKGNDEVCRGCPLKMFW
jgi:hypothetical protein